MLKNLLRKMISNKYVLTSLLILLLISFTLFPVINKSFPFLNKVSIKKNSKECLQLPQGYSLRKKSLNVIEKIEEKEGPQGQIYWDFIGHINDGELYPNFGLKAGKYVVIGETPSINEQGINRIYITRGSRDEILGKISCLDLDDKGAVFIRIFDTPPNQFYWENFNIDEQKDVIGMIILRINETKNN
jgi:hypothetical protein